MATEAFVIAITTTGTREVQRDLNNIGSTGSAASKALDTVGPAAARAQRSVDALSGSLGFMRNLLVAFSFVRAISGFAEFASTATQLDNKLTTITRNAEETRQVLAALGETSIRTRTDLEANVDTFVRMARSTGSLKLSYTQLIDLTRAIADTVHIAGASTAQAKRALMDFAEGLAAGSLQGRQLRAMIMQLPTLGDAIAKSFGLAGAQLMEFLKQHPGSLTPVAIIKSLQAALPGLDAMIGKTQVTIGQAFTNMQTKALLFFDAMDHVYGISSKVNDILTYVSDHIGAIVKFIGLLAGIGALTVLVGIVTALITNFGFLFSVINFLTGGLLKLAIALIALPFTIIATGIELMTAAWSIFMVVVEGVMGIMAGLQAVFAVLTSGFDLYIVFASLFTTLVEMIPLLIGMVVTLGAIAAAALVAGTAIYGLILPLAQLATFGGAIDGLKLSIKDIPGVFEAAFNTVVDNFPLVTKAISTLWDDMVNSMLNKIGNLGNETIQVGIDAHDPGGAIARMITGEKSNVNVFDTGRPTNNAQPILNDLSNKFRGNVLKNVLGLRMGEDNGGTANSPSLLGNTPVVQQGRDLGDSGKGADKFAAAQTALQNFLAQFAPYAQVLAKVDEFNKLITKSTKAHVNVLHELALSGIQANSIEDARAKLLVMVQRNTLGVGNEDLKATQQTALLDDAVKKHIITMNEYADALLKVHQAQLAADPSNMALGIKVAGETAAKNLRDKGTLADSVVGGALSFQNQPQIAANSVEALNAALADGTIKAPAYHHAMMDILKDQRDLTSGEALAGLKAQDDLLNQAAIAASTLDGVYSAFNGGAKLAIQLQAINDAMAKNPALVNEGTKAIRDLESAYLSTQTDALSGFQKGLLDAQKTMNDFASDASKAVTDAFNNLSDTLTDFFSTGKFSIKKFADDMLADLDRLAVKQVFMAPLANALGFDQSGQGGAAGSGGILQSIFGGKGLGGALSGQLGTLANPMYVKSADALLGGAGIPGVGGSSGGLGDIFSKGGFFSNLFNGGGGAGSTSSGILSVLGDVGSFLGFAGGGDMVVGGQGGTDSQNIKFKATPGEVVSVRRPGDSDEGFGGNSPTVVHMHVHGVQDVDGFQRSQGQIASSLASQLGRSQMRNNK